MRAVAEAILALLESGERGALATVTRTHGSAPQRPGARLLLRGDGTTVGTVGGGAIEHEVLEALRTCLRDGRPAVLRRDLGRDLGMCCGGRMEVFVEAIERTPRLILLGAGHVGQATAKLARGIGFEVVVVDEREELNTEARLPGCRRVAMEPAEAARELRVDASDWVLIVTHDHHLDEVALEVFAGGPHRYVGMIGSLRKVFRVLQRIHSRGALPPLDRVYAPVGVELGAVTPEEIAVSITAELVALRHGQPARHMRAVDDPRLKKVLSGNLTPEAAARTPR